MGTANASRPCSTAILCITVRLSISLRCPSIANFTLVRWARLRRPNAALVDLEARGTTPAFDLRRHGHACDGGGAPARRRRSGCVPQSLAVDTQGAGTACVLRNAQRHNRLTATGKCSVITLVQCHSARHATSLRLHPQSPIAGGWATGAVTHSAQLVQRWAVGCQCA